MPKRSVRWRHNRTRLLIPIAILPPLTSERRDTMIRLNGLIDTGATGTGVRSDIVRELGLKAKGRRRIHTANGEIMATEYLVRIGIVCGDLDVPGFDADLQWPQVLEEQFTCFELGEQFSYAVLIGMDVIGLCDLAVRQSGEAELILP